LILETLVVGPLQTNCYILGDEKSRDAVVIDPGGDFVEIEQTLRNLNLKVKYIVLTHGHFDHTDALAKLKKVTGAEVLIHSADANMLSSSGRVQPFCLETGTEACPADRTLAEGDKIKFGAYELEVLHTPGHTPGGISLVVDKMIFVGDTLFCGSVGRTDLPGGSYEQLMHSINNKLLSRLDEFLVYPGHGPSSTIGKERESNPFLNE
jgi:hydroxyacylglutathione hydrolase